MVETYKSNLITFFEFLPKISYHNNEYLQTFYINTEIFIYKFQNQ